MKKLSAVITSAALIVSVAAFAGEGKHPCKGLKGKERAECVKAQKVKRAEAKGAAKEAVKEATK